MITPNTIQAIQQLPIEDVVGKYIAIKRHEACCPFHGEKTPSFRTNVAHNYFKCFGCGEGGDGISFVMKHEKLPFTEAIERIARDHNIAIEYSEQESPEVLEAKANKLNQAKAILEYCTQYYHQQLLSNTNIQAYLAERNITIDDIRTETLGYAPDGFKNVATHIINQGWYDVAVEIGIINTKEGTSSTYDVYRNRIIIPIRDSYGSIVGLAGRIVGDEKPKYINPKESFIYNKSKILYGLNEARPAIKELGYCLLTEGYLDVISCRKYGVHHIVASCGTAITDEQLNVIKRHTNTISVLTDNDAAGRKAAIDITHRACKLGMVVNIPIVPFKDADEMARGFQNEQNALLN